MKRGELYRVYRGNKNDRKAKPARLAAEAWLYDSSEPEASSSFQAGGRPGGEHAAPKDFRVFVVLSRQTLLDSRFSTAICAPVYSRYDGLSTQVEVGVEEGLKKPSCIFCDELVSVDKTRLTDYVGSLRPSKLHALDGALQIALDIEWVGATESALTEWQSRDDDDP